MPTTAGRAPGYDKYPDHKVTIAPFSGAVRVKVGGTVIADTTSAMEVRETGYDPVYYIPRKDVRMGRLLRSEHHTMCPFKGKASYWTIALDDGQMENGAWSYEQPFDEAAGVAEFVAFYPDKVDAIEIQRA